MSEKTLSNPILEDIRRRLDLGAGYVPIDMRNDVVVLMNLVMHLDSVVEQMVTSPANEEKATPAALGVMHRMYQKEVRNHDSAKEELKIAKKELDNINRWVRVRGSVLADQLKLASKISPLEVEKIYRDKLGVN